MFLSSFPILSSQTTVLRFCCVDIMASNQYSNLEVVPPADNIDNQKYSYSSPEPTHPQPYTDQPNGGQGLGPKPYAQPPYGADTDKIHQEGATHEQDRPRTICGLRRRTFFIIVAVVLIVIIGAAVGGGVGGAAASKKSNNSNSSNSSSQSSAIPTPTTTETQSITTTTIIAASATLLRDCDSSNNSIYSTTLGDTSFSFRKLCSNSFTNVNGIDSVVGKQVNTLNDCINLCATYNVANKTQIQSGQNRICNTVCWRNTGDPINDAAPGFCFGFTTQNITINGQTEFKINSPAETRCDSAGLMNQDF